MGDVYAATDDNLDREVAIKVLGAAVDIDMHRRRFLREARLAARLHHPNIAAVFEVDEHEGRLYIVIELLDGQSLRALLASRRLSVDESAGLARDIARALARAHAGDVVHRDIKPENIFVTSPAPGALLAKVLDFGLAREQQPGDAPAFASAGAEPPGGDACGTAGYLAPEQARGLNVDVRGDVFSCGAVLYEMFTGRRAFDGPDPGARRLAVLQDEPLPLRPLAPEVGADIEAIVTRCLAKAPEHRFADGAELLAALEDVMRASQRSLSVAVEIPSWHLSEETEAASPVVAPPTVLPRPLRRRVPILASLGACLLLTTLLLSQAPSRAARLDTSMASPNALEVNGEVLASFEPAPTLPVPVQVPDPPRPIVVAPPPRPRVTPPAVSVGPPPLAPAAPAPLPLTGTIRVRDELTIVVDGEHRRVRDGTVSVACGRRRVRVGLHFEKNVDVPCGGELSM